MNDKNKIIIRVCRDGKNKYYCPHCNIQLTSNLKNEKCRKCGGVVKW